MLIGYSVFLGECWLSEASDDGESPMSIVIGDTAESDEQREQLQKARCVKIFTDSNNLGRWNRPELNAMLSALNCGDEVIVWKLNCLSHSLKDCLFILEKINDKGATFRSLTEPISTGTIGGDMFMLMVKTFADFERESLKLRTKNGITAAKAMGRIGGRKPKLTQSQRNEAIEMVMKEGKTTTEVARLFKVSAATISRLVTKTKTLKSLDEK